MAKLGNLLSNLLNLNDDSSSGEAKPCSNCPSECEYYPDSCELCRPFKEKLIDQLYDVEHLEEFKARYEVVSTAQAEGTLNCPCCGGPNPASAYACEYCGTQLRESNGKIQVASAKDIPDPIQLAQDTIFERRQTVCQSEESGTGILEGLSQLLGKADGSDGFGERMTNEEIEETAQSYGVSVSAYLQGLDNGKYLTASAKKAQQSSAIGTAAGAASIGGTALGLGSSYIVSHSVGQTQARPPFSQNNPRPYRPDKPSHPQHNDSHPGQKPRSEQDRRPSNAHTPSHGSGNPPHSSGGHGRNHSR